MELITIKNNGAEIVHTNYWETPHAAKGYCYLSVNAGTFRLLVPDSFVSQVDEWRTSREVIISRGPWPQGGKADALELLFEDDTDTPYALHLSAEQADRMPTAADQDRAGQPPRWRCSVWNTNGKLLEFPCRYRIVKNIPCLQSF